MKKRVLLLSWVNPNLVPPVIAVIRVLQSSGYDIHLITTDSSKRIHGVEESQVDFVEFKALDPFWTRQLAKLHYFKLVRRTSKIYKRAIVFDNVSFVSARVILNQSSVFYNLLELFDISFWRWIKSPLDSLLGLLSIFLLRRTPHGFFSLPSIGRIDWFAKQYGVERSKIALIYNTPFVNQNLLEQLEKKQYNNSKPIILHTGGVNDTRSVLELVAGFERMALCAKLVITNVDQSPYCIQIKSYVANSPRREDINLHHFLPYSDLEALRQISAIGVCLMKPNNFDSINIAPNKVGEYLASGLFLLVSENRYYEPFKKSGLIVQAKTLEPLELGALLDELVEKIKSVKDTRRHQEVLAWYSMNKQAKPILDFLEYGVE